MAQVSMRSALVKGLNAVTDDTSPHVWISESGVLSIGNYPKVAAWFDFGAETIHQISDAEESGGVEEDGKSEAQGANTKERISLLHLAPRVTGRLEIECDDRILEVGSATQALIHGLQLVEVLVPGTLERLSQEKGRSKRPVARQRQDLYDLRSQAKYSRQLDNGYWVATNNKADESIKFLRRAIELAGLTGRVSVRWV